MSLISVPLAIPEDYISSSSEGASDILVTATNAPNKEMGGKDEKNVREEKRNSMESMLSPLITYMRLLGFTNITNNDRLQKPLLVYNILVIICLVSVFELL
ncbi:hypothetical protein QQG55_11665 [Brugia pahangi]|uniref:Ion_trans domain-containing protein n=1 Tax=Brugia pahangi TaxID=6280 RepID=A0A0N4TCQ8_BRUPA|nr:unnamed protein product [Brugia pahangi]